MTGRNIKILIFAIIGCSICAVQAKRYRHVSDIALAMDVIDQLYVKPIDRSRMSRDALTGMIGELDPYSSYIRPENLDTFRAQIEQNFAGIGVVISKSKDGPLRVVRTIHEAPAERAGLKVGDLIFTVDDHDITALTTDEASNYMRGAPNTTVQLRVRSEAADEIRAVSIVRAIIDTPSVIGDFRDSSGNTQHRMQADGRIAYIHMSIYGEQSAKEMRKFLQTDAVGAKAVILDLRDNAGGLLDTAKDICDMFLESGTIVTTEGRVAQAASIISAEPEVLIPTDIPLIVLIDSGSASASEVTAACLQDLGRAKIAGQRSYGKGSVQSVIDMDGGRARMRLTTAYWFSPNHRKIHRDIDDPKQTMWGVDPDRELLVELNDKQLAQAFNRMFRRDSGNLLGVPIDALGEDKSLEPSTGFIGDGPQKAPPRVDIKTLGRPADIDRLKAADPSIVEDAQLLRVLCWLAEQWDKSPDPPQADGA